MGKTPKACLDIVPCGRMPAENDGGEQSETLPSRSLSKKWRWSFRKRSGQDRVLSPTVISAPSPLKEIVDDDMNTSIITKNSSNYDMIPPPKMTDDDDPPLPEPIEAEEEIEIDAGARESAACVIQAAVRRYLVYNKLRKLKSVVKLQAAIRGHLVRREAAGTLRCVEAIVKLQALVRARLLQQSLKASPNCDCKESSSFEEKKTYSSEKMLSNGFVRLLLESTPRTKPIHITCNHSDSAWKWLERWMILAVPDVVRETVNDSEKKTSDPEVEPAQNEKINLIEPMSERETSNPSSVAAQAKFEELITGNPQISANSSQEAPIRAAHVTRSECGTKISVSSTLDSPDRSEAEEIVLEVQSQRDPLPLELDENNPVKEDSVSRTEPEESEPGLDRTPSSHSVTSKNSKMTRSGLTRKQRPPVSGASRRGGSSGSAEQTTEPRPGGGNSVPSYMLATESARAKVNAVNSPKSSPDGQREVNARKRLSLPMSNGKHDSSPSASAERRWQR
ncbi:IQ-domain 32 [Wolffia australiana]